MAKISWKSNSDLKEDRRKSKSDELGADCQEAILSGFDYEVNGLIYHFSYDAEAQLNFQETYRLFENDIIESVMWTASMNGGKVRIRLSKGDFYGIYLGSVKHKLDTISKYRDILIPKVNQAMTIEELVAITWDGETETSEGVTLKDDNTLDQRIDRNETAQAQGDIEILTLIMMGMM